MFPANQFILDQIDLPSGLSISLEALDNQVLDYTNVTPIQNFQINQLSDGTFCLSQVSNNEVVKILNIEGQIVDYIKPILSPASSGNEPTAHPVPPESQSLNLQRLISKQDDSLTYSCIKCKSEFYTLKEYQDHLTWHKYQKKFKCPDCSIGYNVKNNLKIHMALSHPDKNISECPICHKNLTFQRQAGLRSHLMVHHVDEFYTCDQCKGEFDDEGDYLKHMKSHNPDKVPKQDQSKPLTCSYCKLNFKTMKEKKAHVSEHVKVKRIFIKPKKHNKAKITAEKKFQCKVCQKRFLKFSLLERHERIHSGERPFQCNICEKSFSQKSTLQIHKIRHTGIKPYSCTLCPAKFCQKGNLMVHVRKTHTQKDDNSKTYRCPHCTCIFKRIASLNGHVTKIHINEKPSPLGEISNVMKKLMELEKHTTNGGSKDQNASDDPASEITDVSNDDNPKTIISQHGKDGFLKKFLVNIKKVEDIRWFLCNHCTSQFKKPSDLVKHLRVHTRGSREDVPKKIQSCQENLAVTQDLTSPINPNFKCKLCDGSFNSLKQLHTHHCSPKKQPGPSLSHSEHNDQVDKTTRLYACPICLRVFKDSIEFQTHIRRHSKQTQNQPNKETASKQLPKETTHVSKLSETTSSESNDKALMGTPHNILNNTLESTIDPNMFINLDDLDLLDDSNLNDYSDGILKPQNQENLLLNELQNVGTSPQNVLQLGTLQMNDLFPDGVTPNIIMENISMQDLNDAGNILDANIICMNCGGFFMNLTLFQLHSCEKEKPSTEPEDSVAEKVVASPAEIKEPEAPSASKTKKPVPGRSPRRSSHTLECHICKKTLSCNASYRTHIVSHLTGSSYECTMCKKIFIGRPAYLKHLNQSHSDASGALQMNCIYCRKRFKKPSDLTRHLRVHTGEKPFICTKCNRGFSLKCTLEAHERIHGPQIKEFNCPICNSYFSTKSSLTVHLTIHSGQKPYQCNVCNMRFRTVGNRNSHVKLVHIFNNYNQKQKRLKRKTKIKNILESAVEEVVNDVNEAQNNLYFPAGLDYTTEPTLENQTEDLTFSSQNILPSLPEDQINSETISLLQQLQSSEMIFTSNQPEISSLILDDGPLLNIEQLRDNSDNYQVISMFELSENVQPESNESEVVSKKTRKERTQECQACHKKYSSRDVLRKHIKTIHGKNGQFICDKCGNVTAAVNEFIQHLEGHNEELTSLSSEQDLNLSVNMDKFSLNGIAKDLPLLNIKFDLPSSNIEDALFSNLFPLKKL